MELAATNAMELTPEVAQGPSLEMFILGGLDVFAGDLCWHEVPLAGTKIIAWCRCRIAVHWRSELCQGVCTQTVIDFYE
ncbi:MAG: hypothetical protein GY927_01340 [bacterium]|nr:hypothetical protein [bacterium]